MTRGNRTTPGGNEFDTDGPSWALTEKTRSWVVRTGNNSHVTSREGSKAGEGGVELYERSIDEPAPTLDRKVGGAWRVLHTNRGQDENGNRQQVSSTAPAPAPALSTKSGGQWVFDRPATTIAADPRLADPGHRNRDQGERQFRPDGIRLTIVDALTLQSFRSDYPVRGTKTKQFEQVGNAVPPLLAFHVLSAVLCSSS